MESNDLTAAAVAVCGGVVGLAIGLAVLRVVMTMGQSVMSALGGLS